MPADRDGEVGVGEARLHRRGRARERMLAELGLSAILANTSLSRAEGQFLARRYAAISPLILQQDEALADVLERHLATATHLHLSTHGRHDPDVPSLSELALADGVVTAARLGAGNFPDLRLAFLAGCETGVAGVRRLEEEQIGLPTAFIQAGAAGVIASLWPVFDDAAYLLTRHFYENHLNPDGTCKLTPAAALRCSQAWLRELAQADACALLAEAGQPGLRTALRVNSGVKAPTQSAEPAADRPFWAPHEWAGFVMFGA